MKPWITIVVVAYQRYLSLPIIIHSFLTQSEPHWKMVILHDGPDTEHQAIVQPFLNKYPNISYHQSKQRFNDWGHSLRQWAIDEFVDTPWMLLTNDDNYYVPTFLDECHSVITNEKTVDFVIVDCLMNIPTKNSIRNNCYQQQFSLPRLNQIDIGSFIIKSEIIKNVGFNSKSFNADGILVEDMLKNYPELSLYKINQALFVHN